MFIDVLEALIENRKILLQSCIYSHPAPRLLDSDVCLCLRRGLMTILHDSQRCNRQKPFVYTQLMHISQPLDAWKFNPEEWPPDVTSTSYFPFLSL